MSLQDMFDSNAAKIQKPLSYLVRIVLVASIAYALYAHLWRILFIDMLLLVIILIPTIMRKNNIELPREAEFILLAFVIISFFLGDYRGTIIQIFFGLALGFVGFTIIFILTKNSKIKMTPFLTYVSTISLALSIGALSEIAKFVIKVLLNFPIGMADYRYAMVSLTFVLGGALISNTIAIAYLNNYQIPILHHLIKRFKRKNPNLFIEKIDSPEEVLTLIKRGENDKLEFKSTLRTNLHTNEFDRKIEHSVLKTIAAFLNTGGGSLLIGVSDNGSIFGIEKDRFQNNDKFNLHFTNLIKEYIGNENLPYLHFELVLIKDKHILKIDCLKSDKPVFLKFHKEEEFYIRVGASSAQISGSKLVKYINSNFNK